MKKLLAAAAAVSMLAVAAPASAQDWRRDRDYDRYDRHNYERQIDAQQRQFERRLYNGMRSGRLSEREASRFRAGLAENRRMEAYYARRGLERWEYIELSRRLDRLDTLMTADLRDRNNYRG